MCMAPDFPAASASHFLHPLIFNSACCVHIKHLLAVTPFANNHRFRHAEENAAAHKECSDLYWRTCKQISRDQDGNSSGEGEKIAMRTQERS